MASYILPIKVDQGDGPAVVLLHGLGNNHESWSYVLEHFDNTVRVVAFDLLGFGDAPKPAIKYTPADHAQAVIDTLDSIGVKGAVIAGHSMGCIVAIEVAAKRPDLVCHLVLAGAPLYQRRPRRGFFARLFHAESLYFRIFDIAADYPEALKATGKLADDLIPFVKGMEITDETWPAFRASLENTITQYETYRTATKLEVPALFLNGIFDFFIIRRVNQRAVRANRHYLRSKTMLGPHELTPRQGKHVARIITSIAKRKLQA
jgi:pimeloyl-ACP methyl ester carboxylesterase